MGNILQVQKGKGSCNFCLLHRKVDGLLEGHNYCSF